MYEIKNKNSKRNTIANVNTSFIKQPITNQENVFSHKKKYI